MPTLIVLIVTAVFTSVTAPLLLIYLTGRQHREERAMDYARQDMIAARLAESTKAAAEHQETSIANQQHMKGQLDKIADQATLIHTLVNSDMTAARQAELDQTRIVLHMLRRVVGLSIEKGIEPDERDIVAIQDAMTRVADLERILADRLRAFQRTEQQQRDMQANEEQKKKPGEGDNRKGGQ